MQATIDTNGLTLKMEVAEDCVVFTGRCLCHAIDKHATVMIRETKAAGKDKAVVIGDCDEHSERHDLILAKAMKEAGIECRWLSEETFSTHHVAPGFSPIVLRRFDEAQSFNQIRLLISNFDRKVGEIVGKIKREAEFLAEYPVVGNVQAIESHDHNNEHIYYWKEEKLRGRGAFLSLFGKQIPDTLVLEKGAVVLFNLEKNTGLIVTESARVEFTAQFSPEKLQGNGPGYTKEGGNGSIRIDIGKGATQLSLYCFPGVWQIEAHPELDMTHPDVRYIPMWRRVRKVEEC